MYRFLPGVVERLCIRFHDLAMNLVGPPTKVANAGGRHADIDLGHTQGFAIV